MIKFHGRRRRNPRLLFNFDEPELHVIYEAGFFLKENVVIMKSNLTLTVFKSLTSSAIYYAIYN